MRYYDILVDDVSVWSAQNRDGTPNRQAQNVELDVLVYSGQAAAGNSTITIHGPHLGELMDANNLYTQTVTVKAGMQKGLPLVKPEQAGTIFKGMVFESFANWIGTNMELSLILTPTAHSQENPGNYTFSWKRGQLLSDALTQTLTKALPGYPIDMQISPQVVTTADHHGVYYTLDELAYAVSEWTQAYFSHLQQGYIGVDIGVSRGTITVTDGTQPPLGITTIDFLDLVGQPTWIGTQRLQFITVMRGDLSLGSVVKMPQGISDVPGFVTTTQESKPSQQRYQSTFRGPFFIRKVRYVGNFRASSGEMWVSIFEAVPFGGPSSGT